MEEITKTVCKTEKTKDYLKTERTDEYADGTQTYSTILVNKKTINLQMQ